MKVNHKGLRTWIEVDTKSIKRNYEIFRSRLSKTCKLMAVVKSNAYGHSLRDFSQTIVEMGADWLGVDSIVEALSLRRIGIKIPILVLGYTLPELIKNASKNNISITISSLDILKLLGKQKLENLNIHLKIDTGMHRQGVLIQELPKAIELLKKLSPKIKLEGLYTHFASAKDPKLSGDTLLQLRRFNKAVNLVESARFSPIRHAAATGASLIYPESYFDMVRIGIGLYGLWPSLDIKKEFQGKTKLLPALSWKTIISEIKQLNKGEKIGYDGTETLKKDSSVAVCPVGYWHGFPRSLSSIGHVLISGERCKILGRVSMDMIIIDASDVPNLEIGQVVTLIGKDGKEEIIADEIAALARTTNYEIVTRLNPLIQRIYK